MDEVECSDNECSLYSSFSIKRLDFGWKFIWNKFIRFRSIPSVSASHHRDQWIHVTVPVAKINKFWAFPVRKCMSADIHSLISCTRRQLILNFVVLLKRGISIITMSYQPKLKSSSNFEVHAIRSSEISLHFWLNKSFSRVYLFVFFSSIHSTANIIIFQPIRTQPNWFVSPFDSSTSVGSDIWKGRWVSSIAFI